MGAHVFSGNFRIAKVDKNGVVQGGFLGIFNTTKCELVVPTPEQIDQISKQNGTAGQIVSRAQLPKPTTLNLAIDDTDDQRVLAYALNGLIGAFSQTSGTVTDEVVTAPAALGDWIALANRQVSAVVVKDSTGTTTFVAGTDYTVDAAAGFIKILSTGTITAAESLKVSYTKAAVTGNDVQGALVTSTLLRVDADLRSLVDGSSARLVVPIYQASSSGNQDFLGKNMLVAGLTGAMFLPPVGSAANTETSGAPFLLRRYA